MEPRAYVFWEKAVRGSLFPSSSVLLKVLTQKQEQDTVFLKKHNPRLASAAVCYRLLPAFRTRRVENNKRKTVAMIVEEIVEESAIRCPYSGFYNYTASKQ
jgi:hypothetical protein